MAHERESLDITNIPELLRIAEEVGRSNRPLQLKGHDKIVAIVMPPQGATGTVPDEQVRQAKNNLHKHFGSVTPRTAPRTGRICAGSLRKASRKMRPRAANDNDGTLPRHQHPHPLPHGR